MGRDALFGRTGARRFRSGRSSAQRRARSVRSLGRGNSVHIETLLSAALRRALTDRPVGGRERKEARRAVDRWAGERGRGRRGAAPTGLCGAGRQTPCSIGAKVRAAGDGRTAGRRSPARSVRRRHRADERDGAPCPAPTGAAERAVPRPDGSCRAHRASSLLPRGSRPRAQSRVCAEERCVLGRFPCGSPAPRTARWSPAPDPSPFSFPHLHKRARPREKDRGTGVRGVGGSEGEGAGGGERGGCEGGGAGGTLGVPSKVGQRDDLASRFEGEAVRIQVSRRSRRFADTPPPHAPSPLAPRPPVAPTLPPPSSLRPEMAFAYTPVLALLLAILGASQPTVAPGVGVASARARSGARLLPPPTSRPLGLTDPPKCSPPCRSRERRVPPSLL